MNSMTPPIQQDDCHGQKIEHGGNMQVLAYISETKAKLNIANLMCIMLPQMFRIKRSSFSMQLNHLTRKVLLKHTYK